jgi:hypothetical protein
LYLKFRQYQAIESEGDRTMRNENEFSLQNISQQRFNDLLTMLAEQGVNQVQLASRTGIPTQYLSDIKHARRPMTELVARRIGGEFSINYKWLMGQSELMDSSESLSESSVTNRFPGVPVFPHPIEGEPRSQQSWDGTMIELSGPAASKLTTAKWPYILRFAHNDCAGRLHRGDLILISQSANANAEIFVVRHRKKAFLARKNNDETWMRVAKGVVLPETCPCIGYAIGIIWSSLNE